MHREQVRLSAGNADQTPAPLVLSSSPTTVYTVPSFPISSSFPVPAVIKEAFQVQDKTIKNEMSITQSLVWRYTAVLEKLTHPDIQPGQVNAPIILLKQALYNVRQHEDFLKILQTDARICSKHMESKQAELSSLLKRLRETVQPNTASPGSIVLN
ncbi:hypothetical protein CRENBAI_002785 [Crenichthys baileyi]|uniref:Cilia- and flagella-associated protein 206 n=1 Tax=Crenichthys baileyi TaxID=28760 RepID=A0AAV9SPL1_9TELE